MSKRLIVAISVFLPGLGAAADEPQWLKDARAREGKPGQSVEVIDGSLDGKQFSETLKAVVPPGTWVAQALALRKLLATDNPVGAEHSMPQWLSEDPAKLTDAKTKVLAKAGDKQFKALLTAGAMSANVTIDKTTGMVDVVDMAVAGQTMKIERVYTSGSF